MPAPAPPAAAAIGAAGMPSAAHPGLAAAGRAVEGVAQLVERAAEPRADGRDGNAVTLGDLARRQVFEEAHQDGRALRLVELEHGVDHRAVERGPRDEIGGRRLCLGVGPRRSLPPPAPARPVAGPVGEAARDLPEPRAQRARAPWRVGQGPEKRGLDDVLGGVLVMDDALREGLEPG